MEARRLFTRLCPCAVKANTGFLNAVTEIWLAQLCPFFVTPAKAGVHHPPVRPINTVMDARLRGHDEQL